MIVVLTKKKENVERIRNKERKSDKQKKYRTKRDMQKLNSIFPPKQDTC